MELSWLPKRGSYYANTSSKLYSMLEPFVFYSFLPPQNSGQGGPFIGQGVFWWKELVGE